MKLNHNGKPKLPVVNRKGHGGYCLLSLAIVTFQHLFESLQ